MALQITASWSQPIPLRVAKKGSGEIYGSTFIEDIPTVGGIYVFGRSFGSRKHALYIGKAINLQRRLWQQFNNARLMTRIRDAETGGRFLIYASPSLKPGQKIGPVITIMEKALIAHALSDGVELLQKMGTKRPNHEIRFDGNRTSQIIAPRIMRVGTR